MPRLPVFLELKDRAALIIGGDSGAAWKAELLAACGARVLVIAEEICADMEELAASSQGAVTVARRRWSSADLAGKAVAVAALKGDAAARFRAAARRAGILANAIDQPAHSDFTFGTIVNRGPVVVGISTDGAAPVLGQAIRRRIEALLPASLGLWAESAKRLRDRVAACLVSPRQRRDFWERFVDLAFAETPGNDGDKRLGRVLDDVAADAASIGRVSFLAICSNDIEQLTLGAVRRLQQADVILHDRGIAPAILELARREAKRLPVRRAHDGSPDDETMAVAGDGAYVVRILGDGPAYALDRQIEALEKKGIHCEIVQGPAAWIGSRIPPAAMGTRRLPALDRDEYDRIARVFDTEAQ